MARYFPVVLGVLLIVGLTAFEFRMTDRLSGTNVSAEQRAELLKKVPLQVGDWHGEDKPIDPNVRHTAGAVGAVSRTYRNSRTGEQVDLWLIVGHARDVSAHTPNICYPASGFEARATENSLYAMAFQDQPSTPFLTNTFLKEDVTGQRLVRVFWTWYNPENKENKGKVVWEAPHNARWHFGNTRALYKMYLTSGMRDAKELADESACVRFAREFLPEVNKALAEVYNGPANGEAISKAAAATNAAEPKADAAKTAEKPPSDTAAPEKTKTADSGMEKGLLGTESAKPGDKAKP
jgi:hypothetical protein